MNFAELHDQARDIAPRVARVVSAKAAEAGWLNEREAEQVLQADLAADMLAPWIVRAATGKKIIVFPAADSVVRLKRGGLLVLAKSHGKRLRQIWLADCVKEAMRNA